MKKKGFKFSDDDRKRIEKLLEGYDPKKVKEFIRTIEGETNFLYSLSSKKERIREITRTHKHLRDIFQELTVIMDMVSFMPLKYVVDFKIDGSAYSRRMAAAPKCIEQIERPMRALIKILEDTLEEEKKYRDTLLTNEEGEKFSPAVITWIADSYKKLIDPPHPYKGSFGDIISVVLGDFKDRNRSIRRALKAIK